MASQTKAPLRIADVPVRIKAGEPCALPVLLRPLINPRPNQANLLFRQRRILVPFVRGWHFHVFDKVGDVMHHRAFGAREQQNPRFKRRALPDNLAIALHTG